MTREAPPDDWGPLAQFAQAQPARAPSVMTIPAGVVFLDALADGILAETADDPLALARVTVLLPTRRACRGLRDAFLRRAGGKALLPPVMRPLGDVGEDELAFGLGENDPELAPAIAPLRRRLMLARAVLALTEPTGEFNAPQAVELATELAGLLDEVQTEQLGFAGLEKLVPDSLAEHWRRTVDFLRILTERWPEIFRTEGAIDPVERRNRAAATLTQRWVTNPPDGTVIGAGSTGSIPATAALLKVIARLPRGAVVLPGLDRDLADAEWDALDPTHPQFALKQALERIDIGRAAVQDWPYGEKPATVSRRRLLSLALRPAAVMAEWRDRDAVDAAALDGLARIDAADQQQEAEIIALLLRDALEEPGRTAALITPDRDLARRAAAELKRFGIGIDDSAGAPLAASPPLVFLRLVAETICEGTAPATLLAAFKHPLAGGGMETAAFRSITRAFEMAILRGPRRGTGLDELVEALRADERGDLAVWLAQLSAAAKPFAALAAGKAAPGDLLRAHVALAETWAATATQSGPHRLWAGDAGAAAAEFVAELAEAARDFPAMRGTEYPGFFTQSLAGRVLRPAWGSHPRLHILGPLEARLLSFDHVILGGLNEGVWPANTDSGPWMSRPMRGNFGLPAPERRVGQAAHDFVQAACAPRVTLTRAARVGGAPTTPSRWLERLDAALKASGLERDLRRQRQLLSWRAALDAAERASPAPPPEPRPPLAARPRQLSVTEIEKWRRDPYVIYASRILRLKKLDELDADPGAAERGEIIHDALAEFVRDHMTGLPADAVAKLLAIGREKFGGALARPGVWAFWWPRFEAIAAWFVGHEIARRGGALPLVIEGKGAVTLSARGGDFRLTARADRIDRLASGALAIIDYKTGQLPVLKHIAEGYAPQLALEAAMARQGGFTDAPAAAVEELQYWKLSGGKVPGQAVGLEDKRNLPPPAQLADEALAGLRALIDRFDDPATPYAARPHPERALRYNDYAHLARLKEWSAEDAT